MKTPLPQKCRLLALIGGLLPILRHVQNLRLEMRLSLDLPPSAPLTQSREYLCE